MDECPVCAKDLPAGERVAITESGACTVCGLDLKTDATPTEYEKSDGERARIAEIRRLHRIAYGPAPQSAQMTKVKGMLAILIIICILVYAYVWNRQHDENRAATRTEVTYRAFNVLFGPGSELTEPEKLEEFKYWRMSPVRWKGTVTYVNLGSEDDLYVTVRHTSRHPSSDVLIRFGEKWREPLQDLKVGQTIRYRGRIADFDRGTSFIMLKQGGLIGEPL